MHDPMTQAFELRQFWCKSNDWGYKPALITIWHVDPEKDGSDDSCDWFGRKRTQREKDLAARLIDNEFDNLRTFFSQWVPAPPCAKHSDREDCYEAEPMCHLGDHVEMCSRDEMKSRLLTIFSCYTREFHWRYPVRWHFWHWSIQIHPLQQFKRWAFSRCCRCGKGFTWGYSPITGSWNGDGPRWFRSEKNIWHGDCDHPVRDCVAQAAMENNNVTHK